MENKTNIKKNITKTSMVGGLLINGLKRVKLEAFKKIASENSLTLTEVEELKTRIEKVYRFASPQKVAYDMLYLLADNKHLNYQIKIVSDDLSSLADDRVAKLEELSDVKTKIKSLNNELNHWMQSSNEWKALTSKYRLTNTILLVVSAIAIIAVVVLTILLCL